MSASSAAAGIVPSKNLNAKEFYAEQLKLVKLSIVAVSKLHKKLAAAAKAGERLIDLDGVNEFTITSLSHYETELGKQVTILDKAHKAVIKGKKRNGKGSTHLLDPFFVSKQITDFLRQHLTGYGGPKAYDELQQIWANAQPGQQEAACLAYLANGSDGARVRDGVANYMTDVFPGADPQVVSATKQMGYKTYNFFDDGLASNLLLVQLFRLYFVSRGLTSKSNGIYNHYDQDFTAAFGSGTNTHLYLQQDGQIVDLTQQRSGMFAGRDFGSLTDGEKKLSEKCNLSLCNRSAFERLQAKALEPKKKKDDDEAPSAKRGLIFVPYTDKLLTDAWGISLPGLASFVNIFRIPNEFLTEDQRDYLAGRRDYRVTVQQHNPATNSMVAVPVDQDPRVYAQRKVDAAYAYVAGVKSKEKEDAVASLRGGKGKAKPKILAYGILNAYEFATHISSKANSDRKRQEGDKNKKAKKAEESRIALVQVPNVNLGLLPSGFGPSQQNSAPNFPQNPYGQPAAYQSNPYGQPAAPLPQ